MQSGNPFAEEDKTTTATCEPFTLLLDLSSGLIVFYSGITRTKERLERSRRRREALEQETAVAQPPTTTY